MAPPAADPAPAAAATPPVIAAPTTVNASPAATPPATAPAPARCAPRCADLHAHSAQIADMESGDRATSRRVLQSSLQCTSPAACQSCSLASIYPVRCRCHATTQSAIAFLLHRRNALNGSLQCLSIRRKLPSFLSPNAPAPCLCPRRDTGLVNR